MTPLAGLTSLKLKIGLVIVAAIVVTVGAMVIAAALDVRQRWGVVAAIPLALIVVQLLARGTTAPLREMAAAAEAMTRGEHGRQVAVRGNDEVARLAEAFNAMSLELAATDRMRRDLVANVSHELRTPLSAMQATLENIADGVQEPDAGTLAAMRRQVARLGRMVEQLLDLSRMEGEAVPLTPSVIAADRLLERVRDGAMLEGPTDVAIGLRVTPPGLLIEADPERLHQVLANLVENALRYSPPGGTVTLEASARTNAAVIEVSDQGPGIPERERERVFERFYSVDPSRSGSQAGLGLAIAGWIVDLHGGSIRIEAVQPHGCRVVVELPGAVAAEARSHA